MRKQTINQKTVYVIDNADYRKMKDDLAIISDNLAEIKQLKDDLSNKIQVVEDAVSKLSSEFFKNDDLADHVLKDRLSWSSDIERWQILNDWMARIDQPDSSFVDRLTKLIDRLEPTADDSRTEKTTKKEWW